LTRPIPGRETPNSSAIRNTPGAASSELDMVNEICKSKFTFSIWEIEKKREGQRVKRQIAGVLIAGVVLMAALLAWANNAGTSGELLARILAAVVIVGLALAVQLIKKNHHKTTLAHSEGSVERDMSLKAQSAAYVDALVIFVLALTLILVFKDSFPAELVMLGATAFLIGSFWVRYHMAKRAVLSEAVD
jgi:hypothetical protein